MDVEFAQETLDSLQPNGTENLDSQVSMRDDAQEGGLFSSVANSIQSLVLLCPKCHQPLP